MYIIGSILIIIRGIILFLDEYFFNKINFIPLICLIIIYILIKKYKEKKKNYYKNLLKGTKEELTDHILTYKFKNNFNLLMTLYFITIFFFLFIFIILNVRIQNIKKILDLKIIIDLSLNILKNYDIIVIAYNFIILCGFLYILIFFINILKKIFLKYVMKLHFYFSEEGSYYQKKIDDLAFSNLLYVINHELYYLLMIFFDKCANYCADNDEFLLNSFYTENTKVFQFFVKFNYIIVYYLHYLIFLCLLVYDIFQNNFILTHVGFYLPGMFIYNLYVIYCRFVFEKRPYGLILL